MVIATVVVRLFIATVNFPLVSVVLAVSSLVEAVVDLEHKPQ